MIFLFGAVFLMLATIEARDIPKVQIYEIRERGDNGVELRDLGLNPKSHKKAETKLLNLFSLKKQSNKRTDVAEQLIEKLKTLKGDEGNRIGEDAYIYVLNNIFEDSNSSSDEVFVNKTRNERVDPEEHIRSILEKLLQQNLKKANFEKRAPIKARRSQKAKA